MSAMLRPGARVWVAGHRGMVGSAVCRALREAGQQLTALPGRDELDLRDGQAVHRFVRDERPDAIVLAAAKVGGIHANDTYPVEFLGENLAIELAVIEAAHRAAVPGLLFLGSSCIYPKMAEQPIREEALLTGPLEPTNEPYAIAKIAGIKLCEAHVRQHGRDYRSLMPTNLYGPGDNFHPDNSHVVPALLRRFHEAASCGSDAVTVWGSGRPMREFLHVDDLAAACLHAMRTPSERWAAVSEPRRSHVNVGTGIDCTIAELASTIARVTGFDGEIRWDDSKPDGTPRKLLDVSRMAELGWRASIALEDGLASTYEWFLELESGSADGSRLREA